MTKQSFSPKLYDALDVGVGKDGTIWAITNSIPYYVGCFKDTAASRDLTKQYTDGLATADCIRQAQTDDYLFIGLQNGKECWAGNSYGKHGQADDSMCNTKCGTDAAKKCGNADHNSVYRIGYGNLQANVASKCLEGGVLDADCCGGDECIDGYEIFKTSTICSGSSYRS